MDELYYQTYWTLYLPQNAPINSNITIWEVVISFFFGVLLITIFTLVLDQWHKEQIKEMEKEFKLLEYQNNSDLDVNSSIFLTSSIGK